MIRYLFRFKTDVPFEEIDSTLMLATLAAECIHGRTRIQLDARFEARRSTHTCWIDADTDVGRHIARIFAGFMVRLFGERSFKVERRVGEPSEAKVATPPRAATSPHGVAA